MRITWKDSNQERFKIYKYRKHEIKRYKGGWITDLDGDSNIYFSIDCAHNAIDNVLGGKTRKDASTRQAKGIKIVGHI